MSRFDEFGRTEHGWNLRYDRPATKYEHYHNSREVCNCPKCSTLPEYSDFYCGRERAYGWVAMLENYYWGHKCGKQVLPKQSMASEKVSAGQIESSTDS